MEIGNKILTKQVHHAEKGRESLTVLGPLHFLNK